MSTNRFSSVLFVAGVMAILIGTLDPLEGSLLILAGSAMVLVSLLVGRKPRAELVYWLWTFALIAVGVGALWGWSSVGGFGGRSGRSMWWALTLLPYPAGWFMAMRAIVRKMIDRWRARHAIA